MTQLPNSELDTFLLTVTDGADLGSAGEMFDGYRCVHRRQRPPAGEREPGATGAGVDAARSALGAPPSRR